MHKSDDTRARNLEELVQILFEKLNALLRGYDEQAKEVRALRKENLALKARVDSTQWHSSLAEFKREDIRTYISYIDGCINYLKANEATTDE